MICRGGTEPKSTNLRTKKASKSIILKGSYRSTQTKKQNECKSGVAPVDGTNWQPTTGQ